MRMTANKFDTLSHLVGNTPMAAIRYRYRGAEGTIHVKCEHYNFTGSIKDRMALHILREACRTGSIRPGDRIVEVTSGNTGIAFAAIGRALGHPVSIIMPEWMSRERKDIMRSLGAELILISREEGGFLGGLELAAKMAAADPRVFLPGQFSNENNAAAHYHTTGAEIIVQLEREGLRPAAFVAGVGTGGTVMGVGRRLKERYHDVKIHPLEPAESPTLSTGHKVGSHRIQGISDDFIPAIVNLDALDSVLQASDGDSILMSAKLAHTFGMAVGISSGANLIGAIKLQQQYGTDAVTATVFADCNKKYLSTALMGEEPLLPHYITPEVELLGFTAFGRAF